MTTPEQRLSLALEACRRAQAKIREVQQNLMNGALEVTDRGRTDLEEIITALKALIAEGTCPRDPELATALVQLRRAARALRLQIEHASNLCLGWIQLRFGAGYTERGLPILITATSGSSFEA